MHVKNKLVKKEAMTSKGRKKEYTKGFGGRKVRGEVIIILKPKRLKTQSIITSYAFPLLCNFDVVTQQVTTSHWECLSVAPHFKASL